MTFVSAQNMFVFACVPQRTLPLALIWWMVVFVTCVHFGFL